MGTIGHWIKHAVRMAAKLRVHRRMSCITDDLVTPVSTGDLLNVVVCISWDFGYAQNKLCASWKLEVILWFRCFPTPCSLILLIFIYIIFISVYLSVCRSACLSVILSFCRSFSLSIYPSIVLFISTATVLSTLLSFYTSINRCFIVLLTHKNYTKCIDHIKCIYYIRMFISKCIYYIHIFISICIFIYIQNVGLFSRI